MKILAIIPARAGSKGIPNKNIRILNGQPLIKYSINNALNSKHITDIIVTTDSPQVMSIAKMVGVQVRNRPEYLCGDDVTLDEVIYDAIPKDQEWDYIVTLQPTSPTLKASTLDAAISEMIENDYDTLISVINDPALSWGKDQDGKFYPKYKARLNRQYLEPEYFETGAFLISKYSIVSKNSRIGDKVSVYELDKNEAIDIDNYSDLMQAKMALEDKNIAIYVNGNNKRGLGHVYRVLEIADELMMSPDIYYDKNQTDRKIFGDTTHKLIGVNGISELYELCKEKQYDIFINDILTTSIDYMIGLKTVLPKAKIINFEDDGEGSYQADAVINALYDEKVSSNMYVGENYYICSKLFYLYQPIKIKEKVENVLITFGGSDPQNYTDRILEMIVKEDFDDVKFYVVLGRAKNNVDKLLEYNKYDNIEILHDISNMPEIMSKCDIAMTSRGRTGYELALLGIPTIALAQNEREEKHGFVSNETGFSYIGLNPDNEVILSTLKMYMNLSKRSRQNFQNKLLKHDLRNGRERVMNIINNI